MIKIKIGDNDFEMASGWDEVSFNQFIELSKVQKDDTISNIVEYIHILSGVDVDTLMLVDMTDLFNIPVAWLFEKSEKKNEFVLNNEIYKVKEDLSQLSIAEYISLTNYIKSVEDYDKLIAIILRKEDEKYDGTKIIEKAKLVREQLKGSDIRIITDFFLVGEKGLITTLATYYQKIQQK